MNTRLFLSSLITMSLGLAAFAGEGGSSGGGGDVVNNNSNPELADHRYERNESENVFHCPAGTRRDLPANIVSTIKQIDQLMIRYGAGAPSPTQPAQREESKFVREYILHPTVEYCFVDELPAQVPAMPVKLEPGEESHSYAYTTTNVTFFRNSETAELIKKNPRAFSEGVIHERLHAYAGGAMHTPITDVSKGLRLISSLYSRQKGGERPSLSAEEVNTLSLLTQQIRNLWLHRGISADVNASDRIAKQFTTDYRVVANGGGLAHRDAKVTPGSYIGVGSLIGPLAVIENGATLLNSNFCSTFAKYGSFKKEHLSAIRYNPGPENTEETARIPFPEKSDGHIVRTGALLKDATIAHCGAKVWIGSRARIEVTKILMYPDVNQGLVLAGNSAIENSVLFHPSGIELNDGSSIRNVHLNFLESGSFLVNGQFDKVSPYIMIVLRAGSRLLNVAESGVEGKIRDIAPWDSNIYPILTIKAKTVIDFNGWHLCQSKEAWEKERKSVYATLKISGEREVSSMSDMYDHCKWSFWPWQ